MKTPTSYLTIKIIFFLTFCNFLTFSQTVEIPEIKYVTVNIVTGSPIVSWTVNNQSLLDGYIIKRYIYSCPNYNQNWHTISTIHSANQFNFEDNTTTCEAKPNERAEKYSVRAFKINGTDTVYSSISNYHQTIFLEVDYDYCKKSNNLKWNNYIGWGSEFDSYEIYTKNIFGSFAKIGTNLFNDTIFTHLSVENNTDYEYYIKAIRNDTIESNSNIAKIYTQTIQFPNFINTDSLIVDDKINLFFTVDKDADSKRYVLYKASEKNAIFDSIGGLDQTDNSTLFFADTYEHKRNYYYLSAKDYCNDEIFKSEIISNIELQASKKNDLEKIVNLQWENEIGLDYKILRCNKPNIYFSEINTTSFLSYADDVKDVFEYQFQNSSKNGKFCYQIVNKNDNFLNKSNTYCVTFDETVFIANALNPKSNIEENRTFKPKIAFVDEYELTIYGSFGDIIFQTSNPNFGWNGNLPNGKLAKRASYLYYLSYTNSYGKKVFKKGFVSLVY